VEIEPLVRCRLGALPWRQPIPAWSEGLKVRIQLAVLAILVAAASAPAQQIAFTWDDVPSHGPLPAGEIRLGIGHKIIEAMQASHLPPAFGFVNGAALEREPASAAVLTDWRDAGFPLGNHAWSHMNLNTASVADWEADVLKNEPVLEKYAAGSDWHWLRYPYLAEGDTPEKRIAARQFLAAHRYRIAAVTMSFGDYMWNEPYARCVAKGDSAAIEQLESSYLDAASNDADFRRATSCSCTSAPLTLTCCRTSSGYIRTKVSASSPSKTPKRTRSTRDPWTLRRPPTRICWKPPCRPEASRFRHATNSRWTLTASAAELLQLWEALGLRRAATPCPFHGCQPSPRTPGAAGRMATLR